MSKCTGPGPLAETLDQQPQILAVQRSAVVLRVPAELAQRLARGRVSTAMIGEPATQVGPAPADGP